MTLVPHINYPLSCFLLDSRKWRYDEKMNLAPGGFKLVSYAVYIENITGVFRVGLYFTA